jgi:hypothetical protein
MHGSKAALTIPPLVLRHGKQARADPPHGDPTTNISNVHAQPHVGVSEPNIGHHAQPVQGGRHDNKNFSVAALDNKNIAAQAGDVAARHAADQHKAQAHAQAGSKDRGKDFDPTVLERIVAEEREAKGKLPNYPGLERWTLLEKMGDGAFSNVYRAKDNTGQYPECAIKVVRKFEMNSSQVSLSQSCSFLLSSHTPSYMIWLVFVHFTNT